MPVTHYKVTLMYDGTHFAGYQIQPHQRTVQGVVEQALAKMAKVEQRIPINGSGRTDAGVHAYGQVISFDFPFFIAAEGMRKALNSLLPLDTQVLTCEIVPADFHARFDATGKRYRYRVNLDYYTNPFRRLYTGHWKWPMKPELIELAIHDFVGTHDFTSFAASGGSIDNKVRTIYEAKVTFDQAQNELIFDFYGNGFLYNMVRIMVGVLLEIGGERRPLHDIQRLYQVKDRRQARLTAAASGLYLMQVYYGNGPADQNKNDFI